MLSQVALQIAAACVCLSAESDAVVRSEFIYEDAPFPQCHASTIVETLDGLVAAWFGGTREKHPDVGIWVARHTDDSWTAPVEVANGIQYRQVDGADVRHPCWNPVLHQVPGGPLQLFYKCGPTPSTWWGMLTESRDGGRSWSIPGRLPERIDGPVKNKAVLLGDGVMLAGSSTEHDGWRVHFEITADHGRSWTRVGPIDSGSTAGAIQPTILQHADGKLQALCRNRDGNGSILSTSSEDAGRSWSALEPVALPNPNSGIDGVTLKDGRHLLVYNHTHRSGSPRNREMLNVAISADGKKWTRVLDLENTPRSEFSYPAVIQTQDGHVHTTYTWKRRRVKHVVIDPDKL